MRWFQELLLLGLVLAIICLLMLGMSFMDRGQTNEGVYNDLVLQLSVDHSVLKAGEALQVEYTISNTGSRITIIESQDTPVLDIFLRNVDHVEYLAQWSHEHPDQVLHRLELKPGETRTLKLRWILPIEEFFSGVPILVNARLYENSRILQDVTVLVCMNNCNR